MWYQSCKYNDLYALELGVSHSVQKHRKHFTTQTQHKTRFVTGFILPDVDVIHRSLLALHTLVISAYLLVHCCLPSAIQALRVMSDKHSSLKGIKIGSWVLSSLAMCTHNNGNTHLCSRSNCDK